MPGDGRATWDFSAIENLAIREAIDLQFRTECYTSFNHANFSGPITDSTSSAFGTIISTASDPRNRQFSLKVKFRGLTMTLIFVLLSMTARAPSAAAGNTLPF